MIGKQFQLAKWPAPIKRFILAFLLLLTSGVSVGLIYLHQTTSWSAQQTVEHYRGSATAEGDLMDIPESYPKPAAEMLLTTHNHWIGFSFIFLLLGGLFFFNSRITGRLKTFLMIEPFLSSWLTFASLWGLRYIHTAFIYLTILSALVTYFSFYFMVTILFFDLIGSVYSKGRS